MEQHERRSCAPFAHLDEDSDGSTSPYDETAPASNPQNLFSKEGSGRYERRGTASEIAMPTHEKRKHRTNPRHVVARMFDEHPHAALFGAVLLSCFECLAIVVYFVYDYRIAASDGGDIDSYRNDQVALVINIVLAVIFTAEWVVMFLLSEFRWRFLLSFNSLVFLLTAVPYIIAAVNSIITGTLAFGYWVPGFLRIWWAMYFMSTVVRLPASPVSDVSREVITHVSLPIATLFTSMGVYHIVEKMREGPTGDRSFVDSLYFMVATFTTIGYGEDELVPHSRLGRVVMIVVIFVTAGLIPMVLSSLSALSKHIAARTAYTRPDPHVIVLGLSRAYEIELLLREFTAGERVNLPLHIVVVSLVPFDDNVRSLLARPMWRDKATLIAGDPVKPEDLQRCAAKRASAVIILSSSLQSGQNPDYSVIIQSTAFKCYDRALPQYTAIRNARHDRVLREVSWAVVTRNSLKSTLIGEALKYPGIIPLLINLVKADDGGDWPSQDGDQPSNWVDLYKYSVGQEIYTVPIPPCLHGCTFADVSSYFYHAHGVTVLCTVAEIARECRNRERVVLPGELVVLSSDDTVVERAIAQLMHLEDTTDFRLEKDKYCRAAPVGCVTRADLEAAGLEALSWAAQNQEAASQQQASPYPLKGHIVVIDAWRHAPSVDGDDGKANCELDGGDISMEEEIATRDAQGKSLMQMLEPMIKLNPDAQVVFVASRDLGAEFHKTWRKQAFKPILHVKGTRAPYATLRTCKLQDALAIIIVDSCPLVDSRVIMVQRTVYSILRAHNKQHDVRLVVEVSDPKNLGLCAPQSKSTEIQSLCETNYAYASPHIIGGSISASMLDTALYQAYFNKHAVRVLDYLLLRQDRPVIQHVPVKALLQYNESAFTSLVAVDEKKSWRIRDDGPSTKDKWNQWVANPTYGVVMDMLLPMQCTPLGIFRLILDPAEQVAADKSRNQQKPMDNVSSDFMDSTIYGERFMITNPPSYAKLLPEDLVYVLQY